MVKIPNYSIKPDADSRFAPWVILGYFGATLFLGAALAPWLWWAAGGWGGCWVGGGWARVPVIGSWIGSIQRADFTRVFNRAMLVAALVCLWPAGRLLRLRVGELGLERNARRGRDVLVGFVLGGGLLLMMGWGFVQTGVFGWRKNVDFGGVLQDSLMRAAGAGIVEEVFFRGALLGLVLRVWRPRAAIAFVSAVFAAVHFLQAPPSLVIREGIEAGTGFWLVGEILRVFGDANFLLAECATLFTAGWILGEARMRTRSLWLPIGLHAGWIFGIGLFAGLTRASRAVRRDEYLPWIGETLKSGLVPLGMLALTGVAVWAYVRYGRRPTAGEAGYS
jgi:membrane protease YdiL (CAAX protease family)